ncbi:hypothetical protein LUCX_95 [Xanthomonas phage vB_XciM_LucasX]|nr:hypothetical protein LUCX_95 [Xanthomonas phage vB_XciM_LucasX]
MLFPGFGVEKAKDLAPVKQLAEVMRTAERKTLTPYESQLLLREAYDDTFGIAKHSQSRNPMSLVSVQSSELIGPFSRQYRLYKRFATLDIGKLFGLNITEFLQQPREMIELMFAIAEERTQIENRNNDRAEAAFQRSLDSGRMPAV